MNGETPIFTINKSLIYYLSNSYVFMGLKTAQNRKEDSIIECMLLVWERMKIIIEPSSATALAIIKENPAVFRGKKTGLIISGGNVDFRKLPF
jgi:threonine dehydratase